MHSCADFEYFWVMLCCRMLILKHCKIPGARAESPQSWWWEVVPRAAFSEQARQELGWCHALPQPSPRLLPGWKELLEG